jgi:hypothetical protein
MRRIVSQGFQITLRGLDPRLDRAIRELARREGISLNRAALRLLARGAGLSEERRDRIGNSLDPLIGTWSEREAAALLDSIQACEQIDPELWE